MQEGTWIAYYSLDVMTDVSDIIIKTRLTVYIVSSVAGVMGCGCDWDKRTQKDHRNANAIPPLLLASGFLAVRCRCSIFATAVSWSSHSLPGF